MTVVMQFNNLAQMLEAMKRQPGGREWATVYVGITDRGHRGEVQIPVRCHHAETDRVLSCTFQDVVITSKPGDDWPSNIRQLQDDTRQQFVAGVMEWFRLNGNICTLNGVLDISVGQVNYRIPPSELIELGGHAAG